MARHSQWKSDAGRIIESAKGLRADQMAKVVGAFTPGVHWGGCSKSHIAEEVTREIPAHKVGDLCAALRAHKRPPTARERKAQREREQQVVEDHERQLVNQWLSEGHDPDDLDAIDERVSAAWEAVQEAQRVAQDAMNEWQRLRKVRRLLRLRRGEV